MTPSSDRWLTTTMRTLMVLTPILGIVPRKVRPWGGAEFSAAAAQARAAT
jgi:hypothetical protein